MKKRRITSRKPTSRKKNSFWKSKISHYILGGFCFLLLFGIGFHYRNGLLYYLGFKSDKILESKESKRISDVRNYSVLSTYDDKVVGIDVSQYQGKIDWKSVRLVENNFPIRFAFIRATVGKDKVDCEFETNWKSSKATLIRGAYHYYRPNENSLEQANNFIKNVKLRKGDLPPVLDIEAMPKNQPIDSLKAGLKRWLEKVDAHYQVKPIIYTNEKFYEAFLKEDFSNYQFWIANYNFFVETLQDDWLIWQFTEKATVSGIDGNVDVNIYNGSPKMLQYLTLN
ncbi:glycoside hydrolase family 25 protein [Flavobacterium sp.]|uniref:glycoside hydrolase family 25 protein n=1 Tax=Flavobacterium sp. TaxID=239 RepID=UPI00286A6519|nr:glycoside hydrolase family 25 protein [Flavobacterium sp.]